MNDDNRRHGDAGPESGFGEGTGRASGSGYPGYPGFAESTGAAGSAGFGGSAGSAGAPGAPRGGWHGPAGNGWSEGLDGDAPTQQFGGPNPYGRMEDGPGGSAGGDAQPQVPHGGAPASASAQSPGDGPASGGGASKGLLLGGIGLVVGLLLGGLGGYFGASATQAEPTPVTETTTATTTVESTVEVPASEEPAPPEGENPDAPKIEGDGIFRVGADVEPGTYRTEGSDACYWARLSGNSGTFEEIIANNFGGGQQIVTISDTDVSFQTTECGTWVKEE